jgi:ribonuclease P protein subunit RPR2
MAGRRDKGAERAVSWERILLLLEKAKESAKAGNLPQADRCVELARGFGMKYNVRIPRELKRLYCKHCYRFLLPGRTSKTRVNSRMRRVEVRCSSCGGAMYYPLLSKK